MDIDRVDRDAEFRVDFPIWTIVDSANQHPVKIIPDETRTIAALFTDDDLARQFLQDEGLGSNAAVAVIRSADQLRQLVSNAKQGGCTHVGFDLSNRSPVQGRLQALSEFIAGLPS